MNISIVIPVYNEAEHLAACLKSIAAQIVSAFEVIVVDNNSADGSRSVAESFPFVKVLNESKQGVVFARNTGFNSAKGEIIGRIDADTILPSDWTERVQAIFVDTSVSAVSGSADYYDFALSSVANWGDYKLRGRLARRLGDQNFLWGANMAVRRSAWQEVKELLCADAGLHEDFDLGIHLQKSGHKVIYDEMLSAGVSSRRIDTNFVDYFKYTLVSPKTYAAHGLSSQKHMYPVLVVCWLIYLPGRIIYRSYDHRTGNYSLAQLLSASKSRPDPSSNTA